MRDFAWGVEAYFVSNSRHPVPFHSGLGKLPGCLMYSQLESQEIFEESGSQAAWAPVYHSLERQPVGTVLPHAATGIDDLSDKRPWPEPETGTSQRAPCTQLPAQSS